MGALAVRIDTRLGIVIFFRAVVIGVADLSVTMIICMAAPTICFIAVRFMLRARGAEAGTTLQIGKST